MSVLDVFRRLFTSTKPEREEAREAIDEARQGARRVARAAEKNINSGVMIALHQVLDRVESGADGNHRPD